MWPPQGSTIGPIVFLMYMNGIYTSNSLDTNILLQDPHPIDYHFYLLDSSIQKHTYSNNGHKLELTPRIVRQCTTEARGYVAMPGQPTT
jgi:hypothetical protein